MPTSDEEIALLRAENRLLRAQAGEREQEAHDLRGENEDLRAKLAVLEQRIERMCKRLYGWSSERHHPGQQRVDLDIAADVPADPATAVTVAEGSAPAAGGTLSPLPATDRAGDAATRSGTSAAGKRPQAGRHPGRRALPADAEVVVEEITVPEHERMDADGQPLPLLAWRTCDKWDYRPGVYLVRRIRRAVYGRPFSDALDRIVAAQPACLIPQGKMTDAALIHTVVEKFADHLPLYRQQQRAGRTGIHLSRSTLVGHIAAVARAFTPIYDVIADRVRRARFVHLDDTPVKLLDPGRGHTATARIWVYRSEHETAFQFTATREGRHPAEFLRDYRGFIVADAYAGHERLYGPDAATPVGCWAHVRRKFHEIHERDPFAARMVDDIQRLYAIEHDLALVDDDDERQRMRRGRAGPLLIQLRRRLDDARIGMLPASDLGHAIAYALARWHALTPYLDHGFLPIDNNPAENALRPWAVGRKNWLFIGSHAGGERAAIVATLIENCRMQGIDPYAYMLDTAALLHRGCTDYDALTPLAQAQRADRIVG
ncbi:MAG: IS66 family transposase [Planctomycetes bacterium]|nr:IS66 family transposase [Planctomycetota bacterium]